MKVELNHEDLGEGWIYDTDLNQVSNIYEGPYDTGNINIVRVKEQDEKILASLLGLMMLKTQRKYIPFIKECISSGNAYIMMEKGIVIPVVVIERLKWLGIDCFISENFITDAKCILFVPKTDEDNAMFQYYFTVQQ